METWGHFDTDSGDLTVEYREDVEAILDRNKRLANEGDGYSQTREWQRVASVPNVVVMQWLKEGIDITDPNCREAVRRKLNDIDNLYLRTAPGRL